MTVNQIAVFLENSKGKIKGVADVLKDEGINMLAVSIADTKDFGILRAVTSDNARAIAVLKQNGYIVVNNDLIGVEVEDKPGGLGDVLGVLDNENVDIEYLYSYVKADGKAVILVKVKDVDLTTKILLDNNFKLIEKEPF